MSATNRSIQEQKNNYYATPSWAVNKLLPHLNADEKSWMLVPGCGDGAIGASIRSNTPGYGTFCYFCNWNQEKIVSIVADMIRVFHYYLG